VRAGEHEVWVVEEREDDERGPIATGVFRAILQAAAPAESSELRGAPLDQALAWARERASRIIVRVYDCDDGTHYASGDPVERDGGVMLGPVREGIEPARRRWPGMEFVDRTDADDPIAWEVRVRPVLRALLRAAEEPIPAGATLEILADEGDEPVVTAQARTVFEACRVAEGAAAAQLGLDQAQWAIIATEARPAGATRFALDPSTLS